ncbi:MAG: hypothetical protein ACLQAT_14600 [Candidatus Binataceae bacterium]
MLTQASFRALAPFRYRGLFNGTLLLNGGTAPNGAIRGLGSIEIGDIGGGTTEVHITGFVLPPSQIIPPSGE